MQGDFNGKLNSLVCSVREKGFNGPAPLDGHFNKSFSIPRLLSQDLVRTMLDCTQEVEKLIHLAGISIPTTRKVKCPTYMPDGSEIASDLTSLGSLESTFYRSTVDKIQYFAHFVRYDVAHAISRLGQCNQHPTEGAYKVLQRVF